ncbi:hypothetical protein [Streptosporangium sandarakinum]|uniref:hypothetical protein n=1 Tax=Streptosporangium sandarakinum TaxID=1260955 RepID=UPI0034147DB8
MRFQLLWVGGAVSELGSELTGLAMPLLVPALTGSPGSAGVVSGARTVAFLAVQMPAGVWWTGGTAAARSSLPRASGRSSPRC